MFVNPFGIGRASDLPGSLLLGFFQVEFTEGGLEYHRTTSGLRQWCFMIAPVAPRTTCCAAGLRATYTESADRQVGRKGSMMDPVTLIVTALIAGAAAGGQEAATAAVRDAYTTIRNAVSRKSGATEALSAIESAEPVGTPQVAAIESVVAQSDAVNDIEVKSAAQQLLSLLPAKEIDKARFVFNGNQFGDGNTMNNSF